MMREKRDKGRELMMQRFVSNYTFSVFVIRMCFLFYL